MWSASYLMTCAVLTTMTILYLGLFLAVARKGYFCTGLVFALLLASGSLLAATLPIDAYLLDFSSNWQQYALFRHATLDYDEHALILLAAFVLAPFTMTWNSVPAHVDTLQRAKQAAQGVARWIGAAAVFALLLCAWQAARVTAAVAGLDKLPASETFHGNATAWKSLSWLEVVGWFCSLLLDPAHHGLHAVQLFHGGLMIASQLIFALYGGAGMALLPLSLLRQPASEADLRARVVSALHDARAALQEEQAPTLVGAALGGDHPRGGGGGGGGGDPRVAHAALQGRVESLQYKQRAVEAAIRSKSFLLWRAGRVLLRPFSFLLGASALSINVGFICGVLGDFARDPWKNTVADMVLMEEVRYEVDIHLEATNGKSGSKQKKSSEATKKQQQNNEYYHQPPPVSFLQAGGRDDDRGRNDDTYNYNDNDDRNNGRNDRRGEKGKKGSREPSPFSSDWGIPNASDDGHRDYAALSWSDYFSDLDNVDAYGAGHEEYVRAEEQPPAPPKGWATASDDEKNNSKQTDAATAAAEHTRNAHKLHKHFSPLNTVVRWLHFPLDVVFCGVVSISVFCCLLAGVMQLGPPRRSGWLKLRGPGWLEQPRRGGDGIAPNVLLAAGVVLAAASYGLEQWLFAVFPSLAGEEARWWVADIALLSAFAYAIVTVGMYGADTSDEMATNLEEMGADDEERDGLLG